MGAGQEIATPPSLRGRTSPEGPVVQITNDDGSVSPSRLPRQGTTTTPIQVDGGGRAISPAPAAIRSLPVTMASLDTIVNDIDQLSLGINTGSGLPQVIEGMKRKGASYLGWDDPVKLYSEVTEGFTATLARLAGEVGVLTDQDVQRAKSWIPRVGESIAIRNDKIRRLRQFIREKRNAARQLTGQGRGASTAPSIPPPPASAAMPNAGTQGARRQLPNGQWAVQNAEGRWIVE